MKSAFIFKGSEYKTIDYINIADKWMDNVKETDSETYQKFFNIDYSCGDNSDYIKEHKMNIKLAILFGVYGVIKRHRYTELLNIDGFIKKYDRLPTKEDKVTILCCKNEWMREDKYGIHSKIVGIELEVKKW